MCINPSLGFLDGCTNYQELKETDPDVNFVDRIFDPYLDVSSDWAVHLLMHWAHRKYIS